LLLIDIELMTFFFFQDIELYKRMVGYLAPFKKRFFLAVAFSLPVASLQAVMAWLIGPFTDRLLKNQDYSVLYWVPVALIGATLIQGICQYINEYCTSYIGQSITQSMRKMLFEKLVRREQAYFKKNNWSEIFTRYCVDPAQLQMAVNDNLQDLIVKIATIMGLAGVILYRNWLYAIISIFIISLIVIPLVIISKKIRKMDHVLREVTVRLYVIAHESTVGNKIIKVFRLGAYQSKRYDKVLRELFDISMRAIKAGIILKPAMQMIASVGISIVFMVGVWEMQHGRMTPGDLTSFIVALILLIQPIKTVGSVISKMQRIFAPAERVFEKLDLPANILEVSSPQTIQTFESLVFQNVSFEYEPGKPVLKSVNLDVKAGECIALVGTSGGGKSTLVDLIPRFMDPVEGHILMNGIDLRELSFESLHRLIAIVSQDTILFEGSVRENVALGKLDATDDEIMQALDNAYLSDWLMAQPEGLNKPVGEFGCLLSGGQKQRVTIARAFLKNAPILILDEATSALDNESESIVQNALNRLLQDRTVFIIAHRLSTIQHADRILVLEKGHIAETGKHKELLDTGGLYHKLYQLQFRNEGLEHERLTG
jgi:ATP-binding cassette, subfamily B, bacterial MsbA